ncbi:MAG: AAA family ATPase [Burkholderiales bacterium]|nr:AAA family ATPase [Burkholderiales bacterium]
MLIKSLKVTNLLSYGPDAESVELGPLNVLIGPNGSGKSNFLEALSLLQAAPDLLTRPIRDGGGIQDWLHKTGGPGSMQDARIEAVIVNNHKGRKNFRYGLAFNEMGGRFEVSDEFLENEKPDSGKQQPYLYYRWNHGSPVVNTQGFGERKLLRETIKPDQSILAQKRDADLYPELTWVAEQFQAIRLYREWTFGRYAAPRISQNTTVSNETLAPDCSNLGLVLNRLQKNVPARKRLIEALRVVYDGIEDIHVNIDSGTAQVFLIEAQGAIPATRLSDGTLRYLAMLALLCDPSPPPLVVLEEPELGLHPDMLPSLAKLLIDASSRAQWIVTTHAPGLIDALSDNPGAVLVCEREQDGTHIERLDAEHLAPWLEKYRLGELWTRGQIGGTRW